MPVAITIRNVPDQVRNVLAARAAAQGWSLQEFMLHELVELSKRPDRSALIAQMRATSRRHGAHGRADPPTHQTPSDVDRRRLEQRCRRCSSSTTLTFGTAGQAARIAQHDLGAPLGTRRTSRSPAFIRRLCRRATRRPNEWPRHAHPRPRPASRIEHWCRTTPSPRGCWQLRDQPDASTTPRSWRRPRRLECPAATPSTIGSNVAAGTRRASSSRRLTQNLPNRASSSSSGASVDGPTCASSHSFIGAAISHASRTRSTTALVCIHRAGFH